jgi:cysteine-rich repeat protein
MRKVIIIGLVIICLALVACEGPVVGKAATYPSGVKMQYSFDGGSLQTTGGTYTAVKLNSGVFEFVSGVSGDALKLVDEDGVYVDNAQLNFNNDFTIGGWFKPTSWPNKGGFSYGDINSLNGFSALFMENTRGDKFIASFAYEVDGGVGRSCLIPVTGNLDTWYFVSLSRQGTTVTLSVYEENSENHEECSYTLNSLKPGFAFLIGKTNLLGTDSNTKTSFVGLIDEFAFYTRALLPEEIGDSYNVAPFADADGDGIINADDLCLGFDDNLDADLDGVPDACELAPVADLVITVGNNYVPFNHGADVVFNFGGSTDDGTIVSYELVSDEFTLIRSREGDVCISVFDGIDSGVTNCEIASIDSGIGTHEITLTVTDDDGLTNFVTESYTILGCGDGFINAPTGVIAEECDDGNNVNGDGCSATCTEEFCLNDECEIIPICESITLSLADSQSLGTVQPTLTKNDLPIMLADGVVNDVTYKQELSLVSTESGYVDELENDDDVVADFLFFPFDKGISDYMLTFESPVTLEDLNRLNILGKVYTVTEAIAGVDGSVTLNLRSHEGLNLRFTDTNILDTESSNTLVVNRKLTDVHVVLSGSVEIGDDGTLVMISSLSVLMAGPDSYFVGIEELLTDIVKKTGDDPNNLMAQEFDIRFDSYESEVAKVSIGKFCENVPVEVDVECDPICNDVSSCVEGECVQTVQEAICGDGFCSNNEVCVSDCTFTDEFKAYTKWVHPNEGILIIDRNGDGVIQDQDFFGYRPLVGRDVDNGFEDLALLDSNGDGVINAQDEKFSSFKIWQDENSNKQLDTGELLSLANAGVAEIRLAYRDNDEEFITQLGSYKSIEAGRLEVEIADVTIQLEADSENVGLIETLLTLQQQLEVENKILAGNLAPGLFLFLDLDNNGLKTMDCTSEGCEIVTVCTNQILEDGETCEDDNLIDGDGCSVTCQQEVGWECVFDEGTGVSECSTQCGDGRVIGDEECDSEDEFNRNLCFSSGHVKECQYNTINSANELLSQMLCVLNPDRCEVESTEYNTIEEQKGKVRDLFLMFLRGVENNGDRIE